MKFYSGWNMELAIDNVLKEKTTKCAAITGDIPMYYRDKQCVKCGSRVFCTGSSRNCYMCAREKRGETKRNAINNCRDKSKLIEIERKLDALKDKRELDDYG